MHTLEKKAAIHFDFGNVSNIHSKEIFSSKRHKSRLKKSMIRIEWITYLVNDEDQGPILGVTEGTIPYGILYLPKIR